MCSLVSGPVRWAPRRERGGAVAPAVSRNCIEDDVALVYAHMGWGGILLDRSAPCCVCQCAGVSRGGERLALGMTMSRFTIFSFKSSICSSR